MTAVSTLVLSPHPDDAGLCLGGALLGHALPEPAMVVTIFGRTNWLGVGRGFIADIDHASAVRRTEDLDFAAAIGVELVRWDYPEASLRYGSDNALIFDLDEQRESMPPPGLDDELRALIVTRGVRWLLAPLAVGGHRDHRVVRELGRTLAAELELGIGFYEDLPYAEQVDGTVERAARVCPGHRELLVPLGRHLDAKLRALACYTTQVDAKTLDEIETHARRLHPDGAERLWVPANWPSQTG